MTLDDKAMYRLVSEYSNAVGANGPDSPQAKAIREAHADDREFLAYANAVDRIPWQPSGKGMEKTEGSRA
jgi:hypothetical protein